MPGEVAGALLRRRHRRGGRRALLVAEPFVVAEEQQPIPDERAAGRGAELVLLQRLDLGGEEIARVERSLRRNS